MNSDLFFSGGSLRFSNPSFLALLALIPPIVLLARRSLAGLGKIRANLAILFRSAVVLLLVAALGGLERVRKTDDQTAVFVVDQSASIPRSLRQSSFQFVNAAANGLRPGKDRIGLLSFDGAATVEQLPSNGLMVDRFAGGTAPHQTNLGNALRTAMALFPPDTARRVVVLSDGNETAGQALQDAEDYAAIGVPIDVLAIEYEHQREMLIERLTAPATAALDETVRLGLMIKSQSPAKARVLIYQNDQLVDLDPASSEAGYPVSLEPGFNRFAIPVPLSREGTHRFRAVLQPESAEEDQIAANNEGRAFVVVGQRQRVLVLFGRDAGESTVNAQSASLLASALQRAGIDCDVESTGELAIDAEYLAGCSLVILSNVSAIGLGADQQSALASYVRDMGGGLIAIGGDQAFSVGGYHDTPLEQVLPVELNRAKIRMLSVSIVLIIDRSGSMAGEKIEMAKSAAIGTVQLLSRLDRIGVIAFEGMPEWIAPLAPCERKERIIHNLARIGPGGGTSIYPALEYAYSALAKQDTNVKHAILLTDGQSTPGDFDGISQRVANAGITVSTIAVGPDADKALLTRIASLTGGRMYSTDSAQPLPQIFVRETVLAGRSGLYERPFTPVYSRDTEQILAGFSQPDFPALDGHVVTSAKPLAHVPLIRTHSEGSDPILAYWQVGLGRSLAFTSGFWPRWGAQWVAWPGFSKLWGQCARYCARAENGGEFQVLTQQDGDQAKIVLQAAEANAFASAAASFSARLVSPDFVAEPLQFAQVAPGRYEARFRTNAPGTYAAHIAYQLGRGEGAQTGQIQTGVSVTYAAEFAAISNNAPLLQELARKTGGRILRRDHPEAVFESSSIRPVQAQMPIWEDLVRLAIVFFLFDVAMRRLALNPFHAARRLRAKIGEWAGHAPGADAVAVTGALRGVRDRVRDANNEASNVVIPRPVSAQRDAEQPDLRENAADGGAAPEELSRLISNQEDRPFVSPPKNRQPRSGPDQGDYTSRLLRAKRNARDETDNDVKDEK